MPDEVQITNVAPGIHIPVVVENKPSESVPITAPNNLPVEVRNSPEIRGTVNLAPDATVRSRPPAFLVVGRQYLFRHHEIGGIDGPITLLSVDDYPWVRIQSNDATKSGVFINLGRVGSIEMV